MKHIIVGTAGHIDHGKTALVKALTGIDADRLKEEKQRGITIDIGFADLALGDLRFGFVDVPGHERFVKNMLAGAHGLDLVMLVIAADESVMPQTREHFDICRLLHVKSGLIALTKADLVDDELLELARAEVEDFVRGSFLEDAPIIPVSSRTGRGVEDLKVALVNLAKATSEKESAAITRLPVDRAFSVRGFGTVVTGTLIAGALTVGDQVEILPGGASARVRNIQVHGNDIERAFAGQRTAINLQGINVESVERGSVLAPAGRLVATSMLDARLELLPGAPRPLKNRARVRLHHGTSEVMARVMILAPAIQLLNSEAHDPEAEPQAAEIKPGQSALVQLRLESPITALPGDRFIVRSYSPQITIGGGQVVDPLPEKHKLSDTEAMMAAAKLEKADSIERLALYIEMSGNHAITQSELAARTGATDEQIRIARDELIARARAVEVNESPMMLISTDSYRGLARQTIEILTLHHEREPLSLGVSREEVRERLFGQLRPELFRAVATGLAEEGMIVADRDTLRLASHKPQLSDINSAAKSALEASFRTAGLQAGTLEATAEHAGLKIDLARKLYALLISEKRLVRIGDLIFHIESIEDLKAKLKVQKTKNPRMDVAVFKELTGGLSRKHAIPLLEYLDRERITRRIGNEREIL